MNKHTILFFFLVIVFFLQYSLLFAQDNKISNFIGINPSVTVEPFYNKGELDVNIFPLVYQRTLTNRYDFRLTSILNLGIRNRGNQISHYGLEIALPILFEKKQTTNEISKGLFVAPILSLSSNRFEKHNNIGLWMEPGYNLLFDNYFAMTFGIQFGGTYFINENSQNNWGNHFGIKIIIGKWLRVP
jgi:hypothetical protein